ncbi:MAG: YkgJ family cysteine cluster protein [Acidobacteria bacterium]|nr:YkgJ family cysteine cluster protein [Acidobacteriota bacterium]
MSYIFPSWFKSFQCKPIGCCCRHFQGIPVSNQEYVRLGERLHSTPLEDDFKSGVRIIANGDAIHKEGLVENFAILSAYAPGRCAFLRDGSRCAVHETAGPSYLPSVCRNFPVYTAFTQDGMEMGIELICPAARELLMADVNPFSIQSEDAPPADRSFAVRPGDQMYRVSNVPAGRNTFIDWEGYRTLREAMIRLVTSSKDSVLTRLAMVHHAAGEIAGNPEAARRAGEVVAWMAALADHGIDSASLPPVGGHNTDPHSARDRYFRSFLLAAPSPSPQAIMNSWKPYLTFVETLPRGLERTDELRRNFERWPELYQSALLQSESAITPVFVRFLLMKLSIIGTDYGGSILRNLDRAGTALSHALAYAFTFATTCRSDVTTELLSLAIGFAEFRLRAAPWDIPDLLESTEAREIAPAPSG